MKEDFLANARRLISADAADDKRTGRITNKDGGFAQMGSGQALMQETQSYMPSMDEYEEKDGAYDASASFAMKGKSKLPKEILESMTSNPIGQQNLNYTPSILDEMKGAKELQQQVKRQAIREQAMPQSQNASGVDYSLIKTIVEESVKKYASSLKKSMLTEGKDNGLNNVAAMKIGKTFSFIDSKGNLYEAQLKFIKNVNQK